LARAIQLTGKIALNEDRVAHIYPLVEGRVEQVKVQLGAKVKEGDLLVVVQSREVGQVMLQLIQDRMQRDFALTKDRWTQSVAANTQALIALLRQNVAIEEIEKQLTNRPIGEYRERQMSAYIAHYKARKHLDRLRPLTQEGAVTGKQLLEAEAESSAANATLQSLLEQIQQDAQQAAAISTQTVKELQTRVAVDETNLKILGFDDEDLAAVDPGRQGEAVSHYPVTAPFDGTIISKDVVLLERVAPASQILSVADLSTVWVTADVYEEHLPLLKQLQKQTVHLRSSAWPDKTFEARVFYTGDLVEGSSRTISLRAVADNREGLLKPGMFVNVEFPSPLQQEVLQVPVGAVLEHESKSFVFVHVKDDLFERRDVTPGQHSDQQVEIRAGLEPGERVVTSGGFALKSRMLAELLAE
jgi:cobalt-zinc-cadmium efflux system membrane fusion protein